MIAFCYLAYAGDNADYRLIRLAPALQVQILNLTPRLLIWLLLYQWLYIRGL